MDIQVSSNFERLLYIINELDTAKVKQQMLDFKNEGKFEITKEQLLNINKLFAAYKITDEETLSIIKVYTKTMTIYWTLIVLLVTVHFKKL